MSKYNIGQEPTEEEWAAYRKCRKFEERENVASWLEHIEPDTTEEQFERMCSIYSEYVFDDGDHDWSLLYDAWDEAVYPTRQGFRLEEG